jgi:hypothetical protein
MVGGRCRTFSVECNFDVDMQEDSEILGQIGLRSCGRVVHTCKTYFFQ